VRFWDAASGKALHRCQHHTKPVYRLQWRATTASTTATAAAMNSIASSSADRTCVVFSAEAGGAVLATLKHPAPVFGCEWCPPSVSEDDVNGRINGSGNGHSNGYSNSNVCTADWLATACQDGLVRVYDIGSKNCEPVHVLKVRALLIDCMSIHCYVCLVALLWYIAHM
jgi:WD40 repeat protein